MGRQISAETWLQYEGLRRGGMSREDAARKAGISYDSAQKYDRGQVSTREANRVAEAQKVVRQMDPELPKPLMYDELSEEAQRAVHDFDYFRKRYLGRDEKPWQSVAAQVVVDRLESDEREWVVINVPPGSGKSTTFTHDIPCWLIVRGRALGQDIRTMIGSRTQRQATQYGRRLRATLMRNRPVEGAEAVLAKDFGQFQPVDSTLWRAEEFIVWENPDEQPSDEKEPTVMCAGMDTGFLGGRFRFVIWDDLVDASTLRTEQARSKQRQWFEDEAESRLEPGGLFILQGQRLDPDDLYKFALDKEGVDADGEPDGQKKYQHVIFPAHDDDACEGLHDRTDPPWPEGCLLDPVRLSWRDLMTIKNNNPRRYDIIMQQKDLDPAGVLVPRVFVEGGEWEGRHLPGCLDDRRRLHQLPEGLDVTKLISAISVDPSPSKFWSIQWWVYDQSTELRYLMDLHRGAMDAPDFLDRIPGVGFVGIAEEWVVRSHELGLPVTDIIVERNAAQRFLLQYEHVRDWQALRGVNIIPHDTHGSNKSDPQFGVQTLRPLYMFGRVRLPYLDGDFYAQEASDALIDEVTVWPSGRTDDCVMAQWMFEWNLPSLSTHTVELPTREVPSWVTRAAG